MRARAAHETLRSKSRRPMNSYQPQLVFSRLRAPREDRTALIEPPLEDVAELVAKNVRDRGRLSDVDLGGRSLADVSLLARAELLAAARRWTGAYRNVSPPDANDRIYLAGHQPQMFHPGVWFKNFVLGEAASRDGATAVNLIIDGDTLADATLRVPGGSIDEPNAVQVAFDAPGLGIPYEDRKIADRELFGSFGRRAIEQMAGLVGDPLLKEYWPLVQTRARECDNLGACLVQARHQLEASWGLETLEVPQSWVCRGEAFQWFVAHLLARLPKFRNAYNESLHEYRQRHHVRSRSHPAPDLIEEGAWCEAPFWLWTAENPRRRRLFVQTTADEMLLSDRQSWEARLPLSPESDAAGAVERLVELQRGSVRIRPRALVTTLWARLALGDLFIHGIGGAKYDCVTDRLVERFFGLAAPRFLVVSATLHLPIERRRATPEDVRAMQHELRAMTYQPERYLGGAGDSDCQEGRNGLDAGVPAEAIEQKGTEQVVGDVSVRSKESWRQPPPSPIEDLIAEKRRWIATPQTAQNARERCQAIRRVNAALQPSLDERREQLSRHLAETSRRLQAEGILAWREYAFCLYPESTLREFLSGLLHRNV
jgi:hypothetical protein